MPLNSWNSFSHYDPMMGEDAICITGYTGRGAYWIRAPLTPAGKSRRAQRKELLGRIEAAIERDDVLVYGVLVDGVRVGGGEQAIEVGEVSTDGPPPVRNTVEDEHGRSGEDRGIW